jgi:hypothetical protein
VRTAGLWEMSVKRLSVTAAMNLYEAALTTLPEVSSLHVGFDEDKPVIIVTVKRMTEELDRKIAQLAPNAPIKLIQVGEKKPGSELEPASETVRRGQESGKKTIKAHDAGEKYGNTIRKMKSVTSVDVGKKADKTVLIVRAFPLSDSVKESIRSVAPDAPLVFKESRYRKVSRHSIQDFLYQKLKIPALSLVCFTILLVVLSPLYYALGDIEFALGASSAEGLVVSAERPVMNLQNRDDITQEVTVKFSAGRDVVVFTQQTALFKTLTHMDNMNAEPYHKDEPVTVAYKSHDPLSTARIFDRSRFWATIMLYTLTVILMCLISWHAWRKWQEW